MVAVPVVSTITPSPLAVMTVWLMSAAPSATMMPAVVWFVRRLLVMLAVPSPTTSTPNRAAPSSTEASMLSVPSSTLAPTSPPPVELSESVSSAPASTRALPLAQSMKLNPSIVTLTAAPVTTAPEAAPKLPPSMTGASGPGPARVSPGSPTMARGWLTVKLSG